MSDHRTPGDTGQPTDLSLESHSSSQAGSVPEIIRAPELTTQLPIGTLEQRRESRLLREENGERASTRGRDTHAGIVLADSNPNTRAVNAPHADEPSKSNPRMDQEGPTTSW